MFKAPKRKVTKIFLHCSASDNPAHDNAATIKKWHIERGFSNIGYHFYIRKDGTLEEGRNLEVVPAAQQNHNSGSIAICCGGLKDFPPKQMSALIKLCNEIHAELPDATFHGHCEVSNKACPVFDYKRTLQLDDMGRML